MSLWNGRDDEAEARAQELQDAHNQGEIDASNGVNDRPHGDLDIILSLGVESMERKEETNAAYQAGRDNHNNQ